MSCVSFLVQAGQFGGNACQVEWKVLSDLPFRETEQVMYVVLWCIAMA